MKAIKCPKCKDTLWVKNEASYGICKKCRIRVYDDDIAPRGDENQLDAKEEGVPKVKGDSVAPSENGEKPEIEGNNTLPPSQEPEAPSEEPSKLEVEDTMEETPKSSENSPKEEFKCPECDAVVQELSDCESCGAEITWSEE